MENSFTEALSKRTTEELIKMVTVERATYQAAAIEAAEKELTRRGTDISKIQQVSATYTKQAEQEKVTESGVSVWKRLVHFVVDMLVWLVLSIVLGYLADLIGVLDQDIVGYSILTFTFFGYFVFMETTYQKTIGKFLTSTKVVMKDGSRPGTGDIFVRTVCRLLPFDWISYLFTSAGIHDYASGTRVVND